MSSAPEEAEPAATKKRTAPIDDTANCDEKPPAKKRREEKVSAPCLLLELCPDILGNVRSFLTLKEGLVLRSTCRQLHNDGYAVFRYSSLLYSPKPVTSNDSDANLYYRIQKSVLLTNIDSGAEKLRALMRNDCMTAAYAGNLLSAIIETSPTDNGEAISALLTAKEISVKNSLTYEMELALRRNFTRMAAALQQDERLQAEAEIRMCATCNQNIGCYYCVRHLDCSILPDATVMAPHGEWSDWSELPEGFQEPRKFCQSCATADNTFCKVCSEYYCPDCIGADNYLQCNECKAFICFHDKFDATMLNCTNCGFMDDMLMCRSCVQPGQEWIETEDDDMFCSQTCQTEYDVLNN